jgi:hypothetical protein
VTETEFGPPLFDDNPATLDLLGFAPIASAIATIVLDDRLDPMTVGIDSPWGGGKSSTLRLVAGALRSKPDVLVVEVDPWEFADSGDPRGTLISRVLDELEREVKDRAARDWQDADLSAKAKLVAEAIPAKLDDLRRRISWAKVLQASAKSVLTLTPNIDEIVDALTPSSSDAASRGLAAFRTEFANLLRTLEGVRRVVVLVDDLDRCLPSDILGSLEAIKLFLSVEGMGFVLAAHEAFIRDSIGFQLAKVGRGDFAQRYTEKIVQLPFTLPQLSRDDAEAYIALLLLGATPGITEGQLRDTANAASKRRAVANAPFVVEGEMGIEGGAEIVSQARSISLGMPADSLTTPRAIKRFLNNQAIRGTIARAWGATISGEVMMKMWLLEQTWNAEFLSIAALSQSERSAALIALETEDLGNDDRAQLRQWAREGVHLSTRMPEVTAYVTLAAAVLTNVSIGGDLSIPEAELLASLRDSSEVIRRSALEQVGELDPQRRRALVGQLAGSVAAGEIEYVLGSLASIVDSHPELVPLVDEVLARRESMAVFGIEHVPWLARFPNALNSIAEASGDADFKRAAAEELDSGIT